MHKVATSPEGGERVTEKRGKSSEEDRSEGALDKAKGKAKEAAGAISGNEELKAEGRADQSAGTFKEKKGKVKDLFK
jgi:uncharacterized protein YjbJ (UPF0337 family)